MSQETNAVVDKDGLARELLMQLETRKLTLGDIAEVLELGLGFVRGRAKERLLQLQTESNQLQLLLDPTKATRVRRTTSPVAGAAPAAEDAATDDDNERASDELIVTTFMLGKEGMAMLAIIDGTSLPGERVAGALERLRRVHRVEVTGRGRGAAWRYRPQPVSAVAPPGPAANAPDSTVSA